VRRLAALTAMLALCAPAPAAQAAGRCGDHPWCDMSKSPDERAGLLLGALTEDEKIGLLAGDELFGVSGRAGLHTGTEKGVDRVGLPPVYYSDGPVGVRQGKATPMPVPMALAATFDPSLARLHGATIATEARFKGNDVLFAPTVNLMRTPLNGRTFESYGEDPYVMSRMGVEWIRGAQDQGLIASVKHYAANNQEGRSPLANGSRPGQPLGPPALEGNRMTVNAEVDERSLREMYLPHYEAAIKKAGAGSVMCSYNRLNGPWACENEYLLEDVLREDWGFDGYVLADYGAGHDTAAQLTTGLDFEPWPGISYSPALVRGALLSGRASMADVDERVRNVLRTLFAHGFFDREAFRDDDTQIDKEAHLRAAQRIEEEGIVMLENDGALPLDAARLDSIALIGEDADGFKTGGGSANVDPFSVTTPREGITERAGPGVDVRYDPGDDHEDSAALARQSDVAIVFASDHQTEGSDRQCLTLQCPPHRGDQDALIERVAAANPNTIVVLETGGPVLTPWAGRVRAVLEAWYPGAEGGTAIARVLFGDVDPGGRLPATFPRSENDLPTAGDPEKYPGVAETVKYKEGVLVGYRWFDATGRRPAYAFGYGLSYTRFSFEGLRVAARADGTVSAGIDVVNTGRRAGMAVPQLYVGMPSPRPGVVQPPRQLKGFRKIELAPGARGRAEFELDRRALSYWDTSVRDWRVAPGCYRLFVGRSSRDTVARETLAVDGASCGPGAVAVTMP
jgi:beta-glucosidase